jgi:cytochrome b
MDSTEADRAAMAGEARGAAMRVWDPAVRLFHWALVLAVLVAGWTGVWVGDRAITLHVMVGIGVGALVMARLVWGFCGGRFARFQGFVVGPVALMQHVRDLAQGHAARHLGHNPLGGAMIVVLLAALAALVATGLAVWGGVFRAGPLTTYLSVDAGERLLTLHGWIAYGLFGLVAAHVLGALGESLRTSENLAGAMVTGRKERRAFDHAPAEVTAQPFVALAMVVAGLGAALALGASQARRPVPGAPALIADSAYASQCSDCHAVYHPSLLPAASWRVLMAGLGDHFGEDASLPAADTEAVTAYLTAHAAETTETRAAHVFRTVDPAAPFTITATPFWKDRHAGLPDALFKSPAVATKANCAACHGDAGSGWFYPGNINIPSDQTSSSMKGTTP